MTSARTSDGTPMWLRFAHEYLIDGNGTQAAIRAGASPRSACTTASRWLAMDKVKTIVDQHAEATIKRITDECGVTQERILKEMARLALYDPASFYHPDGTAKALGELTRDQTAALTHVTATPRYDVDGKLIGLDYAYRLHSKGSALTKLGMHLGMFKQHVLHEGDRDNPLRAIVAKATRINKLLPSQRLDMQASKELGEPSRAGASATHVDIIQLG